MVVTIGVCIAVSCILFAWSGEYNDDASQGHWAIVEWALRFGMRNSVALRAPTTAPPSLGDPNMVRLGAAHFEVGCAFCHGSPERKVDPITDKMLPAPPNLSKELRSWKDGELFWIVRHGIKYTGMPGWVALERDDEFPRPAGQSAAYTKGQIRLWKVGHTAASDGAAIMAPIARQLSDPDIQAVASYFASPPGAAAKATPP